MTKALAETAGKLQLTEVKIDSLSAPLDTSTPDAEVSSESPLFELNFDPAQGLALRGEATIRTVRSLYTQLKQIDLAEDEFLFFDLSGLTELDTAGAQLLVAFKRSRTHLAVHSCPEAARRFIELTGLTCILTS